MANLLIVTASAAAVTVACATAVLAQALPPSSPEWTAHDYRGTGAVDGLPFLMIGPDADARGPGPLVLFLHGAGERGRDNERQLTHGRQRLAEAAEAYGAAVVAPQCPWPDYWANVGRRTEPVTGRVSLDYAFRPTPNSALAQAMALLDSLLATGRFDTAAVHLVGISMGGMGVLELAARQPGRFASVTSLAGTYGPQVAPILAMTPRLRFFHGDEDPIVHHAIATELVAEIGRYGGAVDYTLYPGVNHGSWVPAFREPEFWSWVFEE